MNGIGKSIRLFLGMVLFIPQFILALFVGAGREFPEGTFGTKGAVKLANIVINFIKEMLGEEQPVAKATPTNRKPRAKKPVVKKKP